MNYAALEKSLERQVVSPVYLFYGEEAYLRSKYIERFKSLVPEEVRDFNMDIVDARDTGPEAIINMAETLPFMAERRLVIVKNADFFKARRKTKSDNNDNSEDKGLLADSDHDETEDKSAIPPSMLTYLDNPPVTTCLVFCTDTVDRKKKIYKLIEKNGQVVDFSPLKGRELSEWVDRRARALGKVIAPAAAAALTAAVGNHLQQLNSELEKLASFVKTEKITAADVEAMTSRTAELSIFDLVDAVGERRYEKAIRLAQEMVFLGEPIIRILFMVARQFRLILQVKGFLSAGTGESQLAGQMRVHPFVAQKCARQARNFTVPELRTAMEKILQTDVKIKTGQQDPGLALELLIIELCEKAR